jgi:hypothetical protein
MIFQFYLNIGDITLGFAQQFLSAEKRSVALCVVEICQTLMSESSSCAPTLAVCLSACKRGPSLKKRLGHSINQVNVGTGLEGGARDEFEAERVVGGGSAAEAGVGGIDDFKISAESLVQFRVDYCVAEGLRKYVNIQKNEVDDKLADLEDGLKNLMRVKENAKMELESARKDKESID